MKLEVSLVVVGAVLSMVGYSLNDTIIIFDRVRENLHKYKRDDFADVLNRSINETLPRSVLTHGTTLSTLLALALFGGEVIRPFALVMFFGVFTGTFSSIYIAAPVLLAIEQRWPGADARGSTGQGRGNAASGGGSGAGRRCRRPDRSPCWSTRTATSPTRPSRRTCDAGAGPRLGGRRRPRGRDRRVPGGGRNGRWRWRVASPGSRPPSVSIPTMPAGFDEHGGRVAAGSRPGSRGGRDRRDRARLPLRPLAPARSAPCLRAAAGPRGRAGPARGHPRPGGG